MTHYLKDYEKVKDVLIGKYGRPGYDCDIWHSIAHRLDSEGKRDEALRLGCLTYGGCFGLSRTQIRLVLDGSSGAIAMAQAYTSLPNANGEAATADHDYSNDV